MFHYLETYIVGFFALALLFIGDVNGKVEELPRSISLPKDSLKYVNLIVLEPLTKERISNVNGRDSERRSAEHQSTYRFALGQDLEIDLQESGTKLELDDGLLWRLRIKTDGAVSHNLGMREFKIPDDAKFWLYRPDYEHIEGSYRSDDHTDGQLWTPIIPGDEIVVELFLADKKSSASVLITKVNQGIEGFGLGENDECPGHKDVVCKKAAKWVEQISSVAVYTINGTAVCTGQLVNSHNEENIPYFLSAEHCLDQGHLDPATFVFYWNFHSPKCNMRSGGSTKDNQSGSWLRAIHAPSDTMLLELKDTPSKDFNIYYAGWDASFGIENIARSTFGIHHPQGNEKAMACNTEPLISSRYPNHGGADQTHLLLKDWEVGLTENNSSGSCLWSNDSGLCIGVLSGTIPKDCSDEEHLYYYGKVSEGWVGGGTPDSSLRHWLDPHCTNVKILQGSYR